MIERIRNLFKPKQPQRSYMNAFIGAYVEAVLEDLPSSQSTSQQSIDTEHAAFFVPAEKRLIPPFPLHAFLRLYETDPLANSLIDADTNLVVSPVECVAESDELCEYVNDFNRRIDLESVLWDVSRDVALYGFSAHEVVGNGSTLLESTEIIGLKRLDPRFIVVQTDQRGRRVVYLQRPGFGSQSFNSTFPAGLGLSLENRLDPISILYVASSSPRTTYGHPLLQSVKDRLTERNTLISAAVQAARAHANPVNMISWITDMQIDSDETKKQLQLIKKATEKIDKDQSRWLVAAGGQGSEYQSSVMGHNSVPDLTPLIDSLTQDIIAATGLSASALGFTLSSKGATEFDSSSRQTISNIVVKQRRLVSQLNTKLYRLLPLIESETPSGEIIVKMQEPDLVSMKEKNESNTITINNAILKARAGIISGQGVATELGHRDLADEQRFKDFIQQDQGEPNPNDPNDVQQQRSAILGKGKNPGPNPTGGK